MRLRHATPSDLDLLRSWDRKEHVIASSGSDGPWEWEKELPRKVPWREFLIAEVDDRPIGFMQIIDAQTEETHYWGNDVGSGLRAIDMWIGEESYLSRGFGSQMMRLALAQCFADNTVQAVLIDPLVSNERAHRFYERAGYVRVGRQTFGDDDCYVYRIDRARWHGLTSR